MYHQPFQLAVLHSQHFLLQRTEMIRNSWQSLTLAQKETLESSDYPDLLQQSLESAYEKLDLRKLTNNNTGNYSYGELRGILSVVLDAFIVTPQDVFVDLGCGSGYIMAEISTRYLCSSVGFEILKDRFDEATKFLNVLWQILTEHHVPCGKFDVIHQDFCSLSEDNLLKLKAATFIFTNK